LLLTHFLANVLTLGPISPSITTVSDRKGQILDAAAQLISERGYAQTSVDDVIRHAGLCGKAHFYHHFRSKEELGYAVLDRQFQDFADRGLAVLREPMLQPIERLHRFIDALVTVQAQRGCRGGSCFGTLASELSDAHEGFRQRIEIVFERWAGQLQALLWEMRPQLNDSVDTARLARFIIATLEGAVLMSRVTKEIGVMEHIAADLKRFIGMHLREGAPVS
jgi:TetR/AcrR family transcriptional regulator, transcriptional repressor for nem operon